MLSGFRCRFSSTFFGYLSVYSRIPFLLRILVFYIFFFYFFRSTLLFIYLCDFFLFPKVSLTRQKINKKHITIKQRLLYTLNPFVYNKWNILCYMHDVRCTCTIHPRMGREKEKKFCYRDLFAHSSNPFSTEKVCLQPIFICVYECNQHPYIIYISAQWSALRTQSLSTRAENLPLFPFRQIQEEWQ